MTERQPPAGDTLESWVAAHGPLDQATAQLLALDVCVLVSRLADRQLGAVLDSLGPASIVRDARGHWVWHPAPAGGPPRSARLGEAVTRTAALLFFSLTGQPPDPLASESALRARFRVLRSELPQSVQDLTVRALVAAPDRRALWTLASTLRHSLVIDRRRSHRQTVRVGVLATAVAVAAVVIAALRGEDARPGSHGLTAVDTNRYDVLLEAAHMEAFVDEHTVAGQTLQAAEKLVQARAGQDDPRAKWLVAHEAWVRTLAHDTITPDQVLTPMPTFMATALGSYHPFVRALRLMLVAARQARGTPVDRDAQEALARQSVTSLFDGSGIEPDLLPGVPTPPGVVAHAAPAVPELEGFRRRGDREYAAPLTSLQRWAAERAGWRLHVVARSSCTVSVVVGALPRTLTVQIDRDVTGRWRMAMSGTRTPLLASAPSAGAVGLSIAVDPSDLVTARLTGTTVSGTIDREAAAAAAPYELTFAGARPADDCAVVWLEIAVPGASEADDQTAFSH